MCPINPAFVQWNKKYGGMILNIFDALFNRRSIRKFTDEQVSRSDVLKILDCGRWAPSGLNNQPWRFLIVERDDIRKKKLEICTKYSKVISGADVLICVMLDKDSMYNKVKDCQGAGACIQNMLLAAHGLGLGAVWLGEILNREKDVHRVLGTDAASLELMAVIALGYPDQEGESTRRGLDEILLEEY